MMICFWHADSDVAIIGVVDIVTTIAGVDGIIVIVVAVIRSGVIVDVDIVAMLCFVVAVFDVAGDRVAVVVVIVTDTVTVIVVVFYF